LKLGENHLSFNVANDKGMEAFVEYLIIFVFKIFTAKLKIDKKNVIPCINPKFIAS
jgi:hypothetical protein